MFTAAWKREAETLVLTVDANDVLVNPDWVRSAARASGWNRGDLPDPFSVDDGLGLFTDDFVDKVRVAVTSCTGLSRRLVRASTRPQQG